MRILVTGATGFVGQHLMPKLIEREHEIMVITRTLSKAKSCSWGESVRIIEADIEDPETVWPEEIGQNDALLHLAWSGLPNYQKNFHLNQVLPAQKFFLSAMLDAGIKQLLVSGTCFEYGLQSGCLDESLPAKPVTLYGQAKNALRIWLQEEQSHRQFVLQWCRLFYMYGEGQNPNSLFSQLERAIQSGEKTFNMSGGEQLRDYLPVGEVADYLLDIIERQNIDGIVNVCSGEGISVKSVVSTLIEKQGSEIKLNLGFYPYPDYEAMAFWGSQKKLKRWISRKGE